MTANPDPGRVSCSAPEGNHEPPPTALLAELNELLTDVPIEATAVMMTGTTNTSITAYSAAVGPSSLARK